MKMSACQVHASVVAHVQILLADFDVTVKMALQESSVRPVRRLVHVVHVQSCVERML